MFTYIIITGADLDNLCREAALISIRESINNKVVRLISYKFLLKKGF